MDVEMIRQKLNLLKDQIVEIEQLLNDKVASAIPLERVQGPFYGIDPAEIGLHRLKDKWCQKSYIKAHCDELRKPTVLQATIKKTLESAPQRSVQQGFLISDSVRTPIDSIAPGTERWMEAQLYKLYDMANCNAQKCDLWKGICARQVPIFDAAAKAGWGEIDLMAVANAGHPIVIELKLYKERNSEAPQRPLFEGVAYALSLKEVWTSFWPEWDGVLADIDFDSLEVSKNQKVDVVLLAPDSYWDYWLKQRQYIEAQESYRNLIVQFGEAGVKVQIGGISLDAVGNPSQIHERSDFLG